MVSAQKILTGAKKLAYQAIARRDHTRSEMIEKLQKHGFEPEIVSSVIGELEDRAYLDDQLFALNWAQKAVERKQLGPLALQRELELKGIDPKIIRGVLQKICEAVGEEQLAMKAIKKKRQHARGSGSKAFRYLANYLARKGFTPEVIEKVLKNEVQ